MAAYRAPWRWRTWGAHGPRHPLAGLDRLLSRYRTGPHEVVNQTRSAQKSKKEHLKTIDCRRAGTSVCPVPEKDGMRGTIVACASAVSSLSTWRMGQGKMLQYLPPRVAALQPQIRHIHQAEGSTVHRICSTHVVTLGFIVAFVYSEPGLTHWVMVSYRLPELQSERSTDVKRMTANGCVYM